MIRTAQIEDVSGIVHVHVETWRRAYFGLVPEDFLTAMLNHLGSEKRSEFWRQQITHADGRSLVALENESIIGWVQGGKSRDQDSQDASEIYAIYILPSHWRRGVGRELMARVHEDLPESNGTTLWVLENNRPAIDFYSRLGYRPDGSTKQTKTGDAVLTEIRMRKEPNKSR